MGVGGYESEVVGGYRPTFSPLKKCSLKSHSALQLSLGFYVFFLSFFFSFSPLLRLPLVFGGRWRWHTHSTPRSPANVRLLTPRDRGRKEDKTMREG